MKNLMFMILIFCSVGVQAQTGTPEQLVKDFFEAFHAQDTIQLKKYGFKLLAPVKSFPANNFGLYDTTGNVWEWCMDTYHPDAYSRTSEMEDGYFKSYYQMEQEKVIRGGSYLCSETYSTGYRLSARSSSVPDTGLEHTGFRCVKDI